MDKFFAVENLKSTSSDDCKIYNINLNIQQGEIFAIVSNSEYELRALLEAIAGISEDIDGEIIFKGKSIDRNLRRKCQGISFLFKESYLFNYMSVAENITLPNLPRIKGSKIINSLMVKRNAMEVLKKLNFEVDCDEIVYNLSNEEKKLVSISRAFNNNPELVIIINPLEALSTKSIEKFYEMINNFKRNNGSIIYLTQHWEEALKVADKISVMSEGQIKKNFFTKDITKNPQQLLDSLGYYNYKKDTSNIEPKIKDVLDSVLKAAEFITSEHELKDVLSLLSKEIIKFMSADGSIIYLIDEDTRTIMDKFELKTNNELSAILKTEFIFDIANGGNFFYTNVHDRNFFSYFSNINDTQTVIGIPLLVRSRIIGIMQIHYEKCYFPTDEEREYLRAFAKHAVIAIEDTRLIGRSALLQESHHRIKNNLQSVINLISLQKRSIENGKNEVLNNALDDINSRVKSIATVHDLLSKDKSGRSVINIREIIGVIAHFSKFISTGIVVNLDLEDILISYNKATSVALIINELISNCVKHAFKDGDSNVIIISCKKQNDEIFLIVENNGESIPDDFDITKSTGLGLSIVTSIIRHEFKGSLKFIKKVKGTRVEIVLPVESTLL